MKEKALITTLTLCAVLFIASACLLAVPVSAADCTANCGAGQVQCSGYRCKAQDGVGCTAWDSHGHELIQQSCGAE